MNAGELKVMLETVPDDFIVYRTEFDGGGGYEETPMEVFIINVTGKTIIID